MKLYTNNKEIFRVAISWNKYVASVFILQEKILIILYKQMKDTSLLYQIVSCSSVSRYNVEHIYYLKNHFIIFLFGCNEKKLYYGVWRMRLHSVKGLYLLHRMLYCYNSCTTLKPTLPLWPIPRNTNHIEATAGPPPLIHQPGKCLSTLIVWRYEDNEHSQYCRTVTVYFPNMFENCYTMDIFPGKFQN